MPSHNGRRRSERCSMSLVALCAAVILLIITFASDVMFLLRPSQVLPTSDSFLTTTSNTETAMARMPAKNFEIAIERGENVLLEPPDDAFAMEIPKPAQITEGLHISSPPHEGICSCWNLTATQCCSERRIHPNHKFGHVLVTELFAEGSFYHMDGMPKGMLTGNFRKDYFNRSDYREVFIIRNWFDAIVSGYLYHKSGRECWLDDYGNPLVDTHKHHWKLANPDFIDLIRPELGPFPEGRGRDLCHYLAEESEETGIRVFAEYVVRKFYFRVVQIWTAVQRLEDPYHRKTLFLCFEDLSNPETKQNEIQKIMSWLYPGGQYDGLPPLPQGEEQKKEQLLQQQRRERDHRLYPE